MNRFIKTGLLILIVTTFVGCISQHQMLSSPDGRVVLCFEMRQGRPIYHVHRDTLSLVKDSPLGFVLQDIRLDSALQICRVSTRSYEGSWIQPWGEDSLVKEVYNELTVSLATRRRPLYKYNIVFRAYNDGVAFRYEFPSQKSLTNFTILDEQTGFFLPDSACTWSLPYDTPAYEGLYRQRQCTELDTVSTPLTLRTPEGIYMAIHEAALVDYASLNLRRKEGSLFCSYLTPWQSGEKVFAKTPFQTPWRMIIIAPTAGDLLLSRLILNLNEPSKIEDPSWIHGGRFVGIWWGIHMGHATWHQSPTHGATTQQVIELMDFADKHGFVGVLAEGWNQGWETWDFDFYHPYSDFNIKAISEHKTKSGVRFIGHHETAGDTEKYESQLDSAFAFCNRYGINMVKTGYVGGNFRNGEKHGSQYGVRHYQHVVETAAKYHIMIDCHEPVMPTGLQRTWPNLLTQEGVRGQEWDAWSQDGGNPPSHTTILPFTRGLAGPMDFTPGTFCFQNKIHPQTRVRTTLSKQLALFVVLYSPLQMASDEIKNYENNPAFEFIASCPTSWGESVVLNASIGEYVTIARRARNSNCWFLGSITNEESREFKVPLSFLKSGIRYQAKIFEDGTGANYQTAPELVTIRDQEVTSDDTLSLNLVPSGGTAIIINQL